MQLAAEDFLDETFQRQMDRTEGGNHSLVVAEYHGYVAVFDRDYSPPVSWTDRAALARAAWAQTWPAWHALLDTAAGREPTPMEWDDDVLLAQMIAAAAQT